MNTLIRERLQKWLAREPQEKEAAKELDEVRHRLEQAMAATSIGDLELTGRLVSKSSNGRRWRINLSFKMNLSEPVALEFEVVDEQTWEFDLVPSKENAP